MSDPQLSDLLFPKPELPQLTLHYSGRSQQGRRYPACEDSLIVFGGHGRDGHERAIHGQAHLAEEDLIVAVSDGMGGRAAGEIASRCVVETLAEALPTAFRTAALGFEPDIGGLLEHGLAQANSRLFQIGQENPELAGLGATLTLGWFTPSKLYLAHIGDSRLYRLRQQQFTQLTTDHTRPGWQLAQGEINERQFRNHPRRNILTRVLGAGQPQVIPQLAVHSLEPGDRYLLCTDGLIDGLWDHQLQEELQRPEVPPSELSARLLARATTTAGSDDTTLIALIVI